MQPGPIVQFVPWLERQRGRGDMVGQLARDAFRDVCLPRHSSEREDYEQHILRHGAGPEATQALRSAWAEWQIQLRDTAKRSAEEDRKVEALLATVFPDGIEL